VRGGDRVAIAIPGSTAFVVAHLAALGVGTSRPGVSARDGRPSRAHTE